MMEADEVYIETMRLLVDQLKNNEEKDLDKQVDINQRRNEYNIVDREEIIFEDEKGKEFVQ